MSNYKFLGDEDELKWFYNNIIVRPEDSESYLMCIASRSKKIPVPEERRKLALARGEMMREQVITTRGKDRIWNFEWFRSFVKRYEFPYEGMLTKTGYPYPQESLVLYFYMNPSDEHKVVIDNMNHASAILNDLVNACTKMSIDGIREQLFKLRTIDTHKKTCRATNLSRHIWTQFDLDFSNEAKADEERQQIIYEVLRSVGYHFFGKGNYVIVRTSGGYHILVHREGMKYWGTEVRKEKNYKYGERVSVKYTDPISSYINSVGARLAERNNQKAYWYDEWDKTKQSFLPLPGTFQYGNFIVRVMNKEDFS